VKDKFRVFTIDKMMNSKHQNIMPNNKIISVEELWQFYNLSANLFCIAGNSEYFNHINPPFAQLLDFTEEELVSIPFLNFIHPDDREATTKEINELKNGKHVSIFQNRHQMKSGDYKWLSWTANRSDLDGNIYAIGLDCTDKMPRQQFERKSITKKNINNIENEWLTIAGELRENINSLLQKSPLHFNITERENASNSLLLHSSVSALNAVSEIKRLSATLAHCLKNEMSLTDNITALIKETMSLHPLKIKLSANNFSEACFNKKMKQDIIKIILEQLNSIINQAQAALVQINLEQISDKLFLSIHDNGQGFNKSRKNNTAISNITSYAKQYNGEVFVDAEPGGNGCTLSVTFIEPELLSNLF
jgi:PAS domain S-box-containing protein